MSATKLVVPIHQILVRDGFNPRDDLERQDLKRLASSLDARGQLQPLIVRHDPSADQPYVLVGGHRRLAALELNGATDAWVSVTERGPGDEAEDLIDAVTENAVRVDLSPLEEAQAFRRLRDSGRSVKEIASLLGVSQKLVQSRLTMLDLPDRVASNLSRGVLPIGAQQVFLDIAKVSGEACECVAAVAVETERSATHIIDDPLWQLPQYVHREDKPVGFALTRFGRKAPDFAPSADLQEQLETYKAEQVVAVVALSEQQIDAAVAVGVAYAPADGDYVLWGDTAYLDAELVAAYKRVIASARRAQKKSDAPSDDESAAPSRAEQLEQREAEAAEARGANQRVWTSLSGADALGSLSLAQTRLLVRALIDPYRQEIIVGYAVSNPAFAKAPEGKARTYRYDLEAAEAGVQSFLAGAASPEELIHRALMLLATAQVADLRVYAPSSRPFLSKLRDAWVGSVAHHLLSKSMPAGKKMPRIDDWDDGLVVSPSSPETERDSGAQS